MSEAIDELDYKGYTIKIYPDDDCGDFGPREWDNLGHMACFHSRYDLGDNYRDRPDNCKDADDFLEWIKEHESEIAILLPLYLYDHSGISMSCSREYPYNDRWDSGQVGFIYVLKDEVRKEYSCKRISKNTLALARSVLIGEVQTYDQFLTGDVYGYRIFGPDCKDDDLESCWGFYGQEDCISEAKSVIDFLIEKTAKAELHLIEAGTYVI